MDDLGRAMAGAHGPMRMLGGGNPAHIPEMQAIWRDRMAAILADPAGFDEPNGRAFYVERKTNVG